MKTLLAHEPLHLLYRGNLFDTAVLVGLFHIRRDIQSISFLGELDLLTREYCLSVNKWLESKGFAKIHFPQNIPEGAILICPNKSWDWGENECIAVVHLAGLPLPPSLTCEAS